MVERLPGFVHPERFGRGYVSDENPAVFRGTHGIIHPLDRDGFRPSPSGGWGGNPQAIRVLAIGCSYVFGYGLDGEQTWPEQFGTLIRNLFGIPCECRNIAVPGSSNDYVLRQLLQGLEAAAPDILLVAFPQKERREFWENYECNYSIRPGMPPKDEWAHRRIRIQAASEELSCRANDQKSLFLAIRAVCGISRLSGCLLLYSFASVNEVPPAARWSADSAFLGIPYPRIDFAGDGLHPGPRSNRLLAIKSITTLCRRIESGDAVARQVAAKLFARNGSAADAPASLLDAFRSPY